MMRLTHRLAGLLLMTSACGSPSGVRPAQSRASAEDSSPAPPNPATANAPIPTAPRSGAPSAVAPTTAVFETEACRDVTIRLRSSGNDSELLFGPDAEPCLTSALLDLPTPSEGPGGLAEGLTQRRRLRAVFGMTILRTPTVIRTLEDAKRRDFPPEVLAAIDEALWHIRSGHGYQ